MFGENLSMENYGPDDDYEYDTHLYHGYSFEVPIYLYIWEILVIVTCLLNIVVISVLMRRDIRNPTYMILVAISISDSLTGFVTLPSYMLVFQQYASAVEMPPDMPIMGNFSIEQILNITGNLSKDGLPYINMSVVGQEHPDLSSIGSFGYFLSEELCDGFMISKFFLSKSFHTVSVWLTVFLAFQKFVTAYLPFRRRDDLFPVKRTVVVCAVIFLTAPILHVYHLFKDESPPGWCKWIIDDENCDLDCIYLWCAMMLGHVIPAILLVVFTVYFVFKTRTSTATLQASNRPQGHQRMFRVVTAIVVVFLIPEIPYSAYLLYNAISAHADFASDLRANRAIHAAYEILMVLSFNANFYIYTFFNEKFREKLKETILLPLYKAFCSFGKRLRCRRSCTEEGNATVMSKVEK